MAPTLDPKQLNLLTQLCEVLQNPRTEELLQQLSQPSPICETSDPPISVSQAEPTLLQRMNGHGSSVNWKQQSDPSETGKSRKRPLSPVLSEYSGRTLMSRLLNHKRRRLSTLTLQRSSPSNPISTIQSRMRSPRQSDLKHHRVLKLKERKGKTKQTETMKVPNLTMRMKEFRKDKNSSNPICPGMFQPSPPSLQLATPVAKKPVGFCKRSIETSPRLNSLSKSPLTVQPESLPPSGNGSSKETQSTLTKSSHHSTMLSLMRREQVAWETRKSALESLNQRRKSVPQQNGHSHGDELPKLSDLLSRIEEKNSSTTETTSNRNSLPNSPLPITKSSSMTLLSAMKLPQDSDSFSPTSTDSIGYIQPSSCQMGSRLTPITQLERNLQTLIEAVDDPKSVTNSTPERANKRTGNASTFTPVKTVEKPDTPNQNARTGPNEIYGLQPKYLRHNLWQESSTLSPTTAEWSETAQPLPRPSLAELLYPITSKTVAENLDLFQVWTPIKVDVFESLLKHHPNPKFVNSVCVGLREGFWPWADTLGEDFPSTHDESRAMPDDDKKASFIRDQCMKERHKGYFSESFGTNLLPGMYSMPIYAVPKPHSTDLRLVTDHSAGPFSLNNMIDHSKVTGFPLDNVRHLGEMLLDTRQSIGNVPLTLWKSDIADAYRLLPMHPLWQAKQIITVDGQRYVDRNLAFGSSASPGIFISFNSLVAWIAKHERGLGYLANYVDDSSGCDLTGNTRLYAPYNKYMPNRQVTLLELWDELGIPHKPHKQVFGSPLTIIGIDVDPNHMTLTLPFEAKDRLLNELVLWSSKPPKSSSGSFKLKYWERLAGWFNWALNVFPLLRPALNNVYSKMGGKRIREQKIYINNAVREDLLWAIDHIKRSDGIHLFKSITWIPSAADQVIFCDACPDGMGFWYPVSKDGYYAPTPVNVPSDVIFYFESLSVLSALDNVQSRATRGSKILIYTDNSNTVDIFRSLRCLPPYNHLLKYAIDILINNDFSLRVLHIPGEQNVVADALSRVQFSVAFQKEPLLKLFTFHPPGLVGSAA